MTRAHALAWFVDLCKHLKPEGKTTVGQVRAIALRAELTLPQVVMESAEYIPSTMSALGAYKMAIMELGGSEITVAQASPLGTHHIEP